MKLIRLIGLLLATAVLAGCIYVGDSVDVTLRADKQSVLSGEIVTLDADAWTLDGASLTYEWTEDGVLLDGSDATFAYSRFVTAPLSVTIRVTVRSPVCGQSSSSKTIYVSPPAAPASLSVVNASPYAAHSLYVSGSANTQWGPNQLRPGLTIPPGGSFTLYGIPAGTWDVLAKDAGGVQVWKNLGITFTQGQERTLTLY